MKDFYIVVLLLTTNHCYIFCVLYFESYFKFTDCNFVDLFLIVDKCLQALKYVLPRDIYTQIFVKWYSHRNAPGPSDISNQLELNSFLSCLLNAIGFDSENIILGNYIKQDSLAPVRTKKQKTHDKGSDDVSSW